MKNKKIILLLCLLIAFLISTSIVNAADNTTKNKNTKIAQTEKIAKQNNTIII